MPIFRWIVAEMDAAQEAGGEANSNPCINDRAHDRDIG